MNVSKLNDMGSCNLELKWLHSTSIQFGEDFMLVSLCKVIGSRTQDDKFLILLRDTVGVFSDLPISIQALGNVRA